MGRMTDEMERLSLEVARLRDRRAAFMRHLGERVADLRRGVRQTQTRVRETHAEMSRRMRADAQEFLLGLRSAVSELEKAASGARREFATDLAGAHVAWAGNSAAFHRTPAKKNGAPKTDRKRKSNPRS